MMSHEHRYEKLNEHQIYCRGCGDIKSAPGYVAAPYRPTCSICGQVIYAPHYHWWYGPHISTSGTTWTSSGFTLTNGNSVA